LFLYEYLASFPQAQRTIPTKVPFPKMPAELRMRNPATERPFKPAFEHIEGRNFSPVIR